MALCAVVAGQPAGLHPRNLLVHWAGSHAKNVGPLVLLCAEVEAHYFRVRMVLVAVMALIEDEQGNPVHCQYLLLQQIH